MELHHQIQELLAKYNYISLLELGSFVQTYQSAKLSPDGKQFLPPRQTITFDTSRTFNDEVLEKLVMDKHQVDRQEAQARVRDFVEEVRKDLTTKGGVAFKNVGVLKQDEKGNITLEEADDYSKASSTFGLSPLSVPKKMVQSISQTPEKSATHVAQGVQISPKKGKLIAITAIVAVSILGLAIGSVYLLLPELGIWEQDGRNVAISQKPSLEQNPLESDEQSTIDFENEPIETADNQEAFSSDVSQTINAKIDKKKALYYEEVKQQDSGTYYIISGSFVNFENAHKHYQYLERKGYKPEIIEEVGKYRVAMSKFTNRNRALYELERLRREKPTQSVWLLGLD